MLTHRTNLCIWPRSQVHESPASCHSFPVPWNSTGRVCQSQTGLLINRSFLWPVDYRLMFLSQSVFRIVFLSETASFRLLLCRCSCLGSSMQDRMLTCSIGESGKIPSSEDVFGLQATMPGWPPGCPQRREEKSMRRPCDEIVDSLVVVIIAGDPLESVAGLTRNHHCTGSETENWMAAVVSISIFYLFSFCSNFIYFHFVYFIFISM